MSSETTINRILLVTDVSNFEYVCMWNAFSDWCKKYPEDSSFIRPAEETDQSDLPDILNVLSFRRTLHNVVQKKLDSLRWIVRNNHQTELDMADGIDVIFTEDDMLSGNFRRWVYPEYKAQRKLIKKQYDVFKVKNYIQDVIFKDLEIEKKFGYKIIKIKNCESDDIIAILMKRFNNYICRILISSDRDFLQLENVNQYDMWGKKIECGIKTKDGFTYMTPKDFLLWKIIRGDTADNIKNVFSGYGDKKAYRLVNDKKELKRMLMEDVDAVKRFKMNKLLIDFNQMPEEMENYIYEKLKNILSVPEKKDDFDVNCCIDI